MRKFNPKASHPARAVQVWQILVGRAMNRQTITYHGLSVIMYKKAEGAAGVIANILGLVAFYCNDNKLPPLTSIVVGKRRGTPGDDIPIDLAKLDEAREKVYDFDWYDVYPPTEDELVLARERQAS
jgi:hypothetical protein